MFFREECKQQMYARIQQHFEERTWRLEEARISRDTTRQWQLIVSAIEAGYNDYFKLAGREAKQMTGRQVPRIIKQQKKKAGGNGQVDLGQTRHGNEEPGGGIPGAG